MSSLHGLFVNTSHKLVVTQETEVIVAAVVIFTDLVLFSHGARQQFIIHATCVQALFLQLRNRLVDFSKKALDVVAGCAVGRIQTTNGRHEFRNTFQRQFFGGHGDMPQFDKMLPDLFQRNPTAVSDIEKQRAIVVYADNFRM